MTRTQDTAPATLRQRLPRDRRFKWVRYQGEKLYEIGILADGTLHNPRNYPADIVHAAVTEAIARRDDRRSNAAKKGAETRSRRRSNRTQSIARRLIDENGAPIGPRKSCFVCGRSLADRQSIDRGIGPECLQDVLKAIECQRERSGVAP